MSNAIQFYGQSAGLHRQLIESVLAYANLGQAKYPNDPEWVALHKVATDNMADLSKLLDGQIRAEDFTDRADVAYENYMDRVLTENNQ